MQDDKIIETIRTTHAAVWQAIAEHTDTKNHASGVPAVETAAILAAHALYGYHSREEISTWEVALVTANICIAMGKDYEFDDEKRPTFPVSHYDNHRWLGYLLMDCADALRDSYAFSAYVGQVPDHNLLRALVRCAMWPGFDMGAEVAKVLVDTLEFEHE